MAISLFIASATFAQYNWKLSKDKDGIKIYQSDVANSNFKSIKVECTLQGNYVKLINILNNIPRHTDWVYNNKTAYTIKNITPYDYYYYAETSMPWPVSNRDAVIHIQMKMDSLNHFLIVNGIGEPNYTPQKSGIVRVPRSMVNWYVTMPTNNTITIRYIFDADPGGSLPAWLVNMFIDKAPYESFKKLAAILKQ